MNYGRAVRLSRTIRGLSQAELADRVGVNASYVSMLEANRRSPSVSLLQKLSEGLDIPVYLLMFLGSEKRELRGITEEQAREIGKHLLEIIVNGELAEGRAQQ